MAAFTHLTDHEDLFEPGARKTRFVRAQLDELRGKTLARIEIEEDEKIEFITIEGFRYLMYHEQECCEDVWLDDVNGDLDDLIGSPILLAEEVEFDNEDPPSVDEVPDSNFDSQSFIWTFYKLATHKGYVVLRWYGCSNGYYSESVDFARLEEPAA